MRPMNFDFDAQVTAALFDRTGAVFALGEGAAARRLDLAARVEPSDRVLSAARRVENALIAVGPRLRPIVSRICVHGDNPEAVVFARAMRDGLAAGRMPSAGLNLPGPW